jgi:hypothetical protein
VVVGLIGVLSVAAYVLAQPAAAPSEQPKPKTYIQATSDELQRNPEGFLNRYVRVADSFGRGVERFPQAVVNYGITAETYYGFRTHKALGSNMICFAPKDSKEAQAFFETPLDENTPMYLMGKVGPRIDTGDGLVPVFLVDRIVRGTNPPPADVKKQPPVVILERPAGNGREMIGEFKIEKSGTRYQIPDPRNPDRIILYLTVKY